MKTDALLVRPLSGLGLSLSPFRPWRLIELDFLVLLVFIQSVSASCVIELVQLFPLRHYWWDNLNTEPDIKEMTFLFLQWHWNEGGPYQAFPSQMLHSAHLAEISLRLVVEALQTETRNKWHPPYMHPFLLWDIHILSFDFSKLPPAPLQGENNQMY